MKRYNDQRVAVVGMSLTYAGCENKKEFFDSLLEGKVQYSEISSARLGSLDKKNHLLAARSKYSDSFCNDRYASIDPEKHRSEHDLLLSLSQSAIDDANQMKHNPSNKLDLKSSKVGVVSGCLSFPNDNQQGELALLYQAHIEKKLSQIFPDSDVLPDRSLWSSRAESTSETDPLDLQHRCDPASYVAEKLDLPQNTVSYSLDAACASSLYVMRLAQEHLVNGDCDVVLCCAVSLADPFFVLSGFSTFQAIPVKGSEGDISAPWRKGSTGLTPGEGGCVLVLKRLEDAVRDGDHIYGSMLACGINNSGTGLPLKPLLKSELSCLVETYNLVDEATNKTKAPQDFKVVQYVECHATGTSQGDQVELDSMKLCFGERSEKCNDQVLPRFGSAKGNFGHTMVAAGFAGICKLLLSMEFGEIPPTPALTDSSGNNLKMHENVVDQRTPWPDSNGDRDPKAWEVRVGAVSAFGFGGTNAHAVFEKYNENKNYLKFGNQQIKDLAPFKEVAPLELSIIGMGCCFGSAESLSEFETLVYNNRANKCELPGQRWRFLSNDEDFQQSVSEEFKSQVSGGFLKSLNIDFKAMRTPLTPEDLLIPQQLLCLKVMDQAVQDANLKSLPTNKRTAVIVGLGTELELYRHKARVLLKERLNKSLLPDVGDSSDPGRFLEELMNYMHDRGTSTSYTSYIGNLVATRFSSKHGFTGPSFTVTEGENSAVRALEVARMLFKSGCVDHAVIAGVDLNCSAESFYVKSQSMQLGESNWLGEGAGAFVISSKNKALEQNSKVYSNVIDLSFSRQSISTAISTATGKVTPELIEVSGTAEAYLLAASPQISLEEELQAIAGVYSAIAPTTQAKKTSIALCGNAEVVGRLGYATGVAGLIKTSLCLFNRYLPNSTSTATNSITARSSEIDSRALDFFIPVYSLPWVRNKDTGAQNRRYAGVSTVSQSNSYSYVLLSDQEGSHETQNLLSMDSNGVKLFLISAIDRSSLMQRLQDIDTELRRILEIKQPVEAQFAVNNFFRQLLLTSLLPVEDSSVVFSLIASEDPTLFLEEISFALKGLPKALKLRRDYLSRRGSTLAFKPLDTSNVCFMYGEARSPYLGLGKDLYRLWPELHSVTENWTTDMWAENGPNGYSNAIFHPHLSSVEELTKADEQFEASMVDMFKSGVFHSMQQTQLVKNVLNLNATSCCGLSLGEVSLYFAFSRDNCLKSNQLIDKLSRSYVFTEALAGQCKAISQILPDEPFENQQDSNSFQRFDSLWNGLIVPKSKTDILTAIASLSSAQLKSVLRIPIVNSCNSCLVTGTPQALAALLEQLKLPKTMVLPSPQRMIGHVPEVKPYVSDIADIHSCISLPKDAGIPKIYTNIGYCPVNEAKLAKSHKDLGTLVANIYNQEANFVEMVSTVREKEKCSVFIELGADNQRSQAAKNILMSRFGLKDSEFLSVAFDKKGRDSWESILRLVAILKTHKIPCSIDQLYHQSLKNTLVKPHRMIREILINGKFNPLGLEQAKQKFSAVLPKSTPNSLVHPIKQLRPLLSNRKTTLELSSGSNSLRNGRVSTEIPRNVVNAKPVRVNYSLPSSFGVLGDSKFLKRFNTEFPLYVGGLWNAMSGVELVVAAAKEKLLATYGSLNVPLETVKNDLSTIQSKLSSGECFLTNITYSAYYPTVELSLFEICVQRKIFAVEIARYENITEGLLFFVLNTPQASIVAKVHTPQAAELLTRSVCLVVASNAKLVEKLLKKNLVSVQQVEAAKGNDKPLVCAVTCIGSNAFATVLPVVKSLTRERQVSVGVAGNIGCSSAALSAFNAGADFISTGSINLLCKEADITTDLKSLLSSVTSTDLVQLPTFGLNLFDKSHDSFIPVLKKGTMFPLKAGRLIECFQKYDKFSSIPSLEVTKIQKILGKTIPEAWTEVEIAHKERVLSLKKSSSSDHFEKIKMAMVFGTVLKNGVLECQKGNARNAHVWCSPALGTFNALNGGKEVQGVVKLNKELLDGCLKLIKEGQKKLAKNYSK